MITENTRPAANSSPRLTLDEWAVLLALAAAILIRFGVIHRIPW
jgi:hypothetical protein